MQEYCKNCGAPILDDARFCPDCGSAVEKEEKVSSNFCENCGNEIKPGEDFCGECGNSLKGTPAGKAPKSFIDENMIPIAIVGGIAIIVLIFLLITAMPNESESDYYDVGTQTVEVENIDFEIPGDYILVPSSIDYDYENFVSSYQHTYTNGEENISIGILTSSVTGPTEELLASGGGVEKTMMGYDGYYQELSDGYAFSFIVNDRMCIVFVSSPYVFDQIEVLG